MYVDRHHNPSPVNYLSRTLLFVSSSRCERLLQPFAITNVCRHYRPPHRCRQKRDRHLHRQRRRQFEPFTVDRRTLLRYAER